MSDREGKPIAEAFNRIGYSAFVLEYTCNAHPLNRTPLRELAWAVCYVRENFQRYGMSRDFVMTCGFSAGAHLIGLLGNVWSDPDWTGFSGSPKLCRPSAQILCYPVVTAGRFAHERSMTNLAGASRSDWSKYSLENMVNVLVPPTFLWHTETDIKVSPRNSLLYYHALMEHGICAELHIFPYGVHGMSLATKEVESPEEGCYADPHIAQWFDLLNGWLKHMEESHS